MLAKYIGTRAGVAEPERDGLVRYAAERPGSTGLFGPDPAAPPDLAATQAALAAAPWHYRMVLSMRGPDAERVGLGEDAQKWRDLARRLLPKIAAEIGVGQDDLRWVGAMHRKTGKDGVSQPHLHVLAWMDEPTRRPLLFKDELRRVRRVTAREVFGPLRGALAAERTARRDAAVLAARRVLSRGVLASRDEAELGQRLRALAGRMPRHGRVALAYMPAEVKSEAAAVADWVMERLAPEVAALNKATRDLASLYGSQPEALEQAAGRARADVRDRVAQVVLRAAGRGPAAQRSAVVAEHEPEDLAPDLEQPVRSRGDWAVLRAEMRLRDPAGALALAAMAGHVSPAALAAVPALDAAKHAALTAAMRRVEILKKSGDGERTVLEAAGPAVAEALAILGPTADPEALRETLAWQCARLQGLRFSDDPMPPTPADALAATAGVKLSPEQREQLTALLRAAGAHRDPATGRIEVEPRALAALVAAVPGVKDADIAVQAYRQRESDWREERRDLPPDEALRRVGVVAAKADLLAVNLRRDQETKALQASGHEALLRTLPAGADRALAEKELVRQAVAAQTEEARGRAEVETDPVRAMAALLGLRLTEEDTKRLSAVMRRCNVALDEAGWPVGSGADYEAAVELCAAPEDCPFDIAGEVARCAARVQGVWADQQAEAVAALAVAAGREQEEVRDALRGLGNGAAELAKRLGVPETPHLRDALAQVPEWLLEPERTPAARLLQRLGLPAEAEAEWVDRLRALEVYRDDAGTLSAGDAAALDAAVAGGGQAGAILRAAWAQDRDALFAARREAVGPQALAVWAGRPALNALEGRRWDRLLRAAAAGRAGAEDALVRMLCLRPEAAPRIRAEVREAIRERRLWAMRPVDALAERLGVAAWEGGTRREVYRMLRRLPMDGAGRPADRDAWARAAARVWELAPATTQREARRALAVEAMRARRPAYSEVLFEARSILVGATRRAEAEAEWAQKQRAMQLGLVR